MDRREGPRRVFFIMNTVARGYPSSRDLCDGHSYHLLRRLKLPTRGGQSGCQAQGCIRRRTDSGQGRRWHFRCKRGWQSCLFQIQDASVPRRRRASRAAPRRDEAVGSACSRRWRDVRLGSDGSMPPRRRRGGRRKGEKRTPSLLPSWTVSDPIGTNSSINLRISLAVAVIVSDSPACADFRARCRLVPVVDAARDASRPH